MKGRSLPEPFAVFARHSVWNRMIAVVCALSFLFVSFTHILQHYQTTPSAPSYELSISADDGSSIPAEQSTLSVEHCHGCSMVASIFEVVGASIAEAGSERLASVVDRLRSYAFIAETPPPIALT